MTPSTPLRNAAQAVDGMIEILSAFGPRGPLPGLREMKNIAAEALSAPEQPAAEAASEIRRIWRSMGRSFSDVVVNADNDEDRIRLNRTFDEHKSDLSKALNGASNGEEVVDAP